MNVEIHGFSRFGVRGSDVASEAESGPNQAVDIESLRRGGEIHVKRVCIPGQFEFGEGRSRQAGATHDALELDPLLVEEAMLEIGEGRSDRGW